MSEIRYVSGYRQFAALGRSPLVLPATGGGSVSRLDEAVLRGLRPGSWTERRRRT